MPEDLLFELTRRYCEPHRDYHDLRHIADMLVRGRELALDAVQVAAVWFHDAIYDPRSATNEADSAALAERSLAAIGWQPDAIASAAAIVRDTKGHVPSSPAAAPVLDLDLASLAAPWAEFTANTARIRFEYAHVPEADFVVGRRRFFAAMLQRERLFWTPWGQRLEATARANLVRAVG